MGRRQRAVIFSFIALCVLAVVGYVVYSRTVKDYVSCARMLSKTYLSDRSGRQSTRSFAPFASHIRKAPLRR